MWILRNYLLIVVALVSSKVSANPTPTYSKESPETTDVNSDNLTGPIIPDRPPEEVHEYHQDIEHDDNGSPVVKVHDVSTKVSTNDFNHTDPKKVYSPHPESEDSAGYENEQNNLAVNDKTFEESGKNDKAEQNRPIVSSEVSESPETTDVNSDNLTGPIIPDRPPEEVHEYHQDIEHDENGSPVVKVHDVYTKVSTNDFNHTDPKKVYSPHPESEDSVGYENEQNNLAVNDKTFEESGKNDKAEQNRPIVSSEVSESPETTDVNSDNLTGPIIPDRPPEEVHEYHQDIEHDENGSPVVKVHDVYTKVSTNDFNHTDPKKVYSPHPESEDSVGYENEQNNLAVNDKTFEESGKNDKAERNRPIVSSEVSESPEATDVNSRYPTGPAVRRWVVQELWTPNQPMVRDEHNNPVVKVHDMYTRTFTDLSDEEFKKLYCSRFGSQAHAGYNNEKHDSSVNSETHEGSPGADISSGNTDKSHNIVVPGLGNNNLAGQDTAQKPFTDDHSAGKSHIVGHSNGNEKTNQQSAGGSDTLQGPAGPYRVPYQPLAQNPLQGFANPGQIGFGHWNPVQLSGPQFGPHQYFTGNSNAAQPFNAQYHSSGYSAEYFNGPRFSAGYNGAAQPMSFNNNYWVDQTRREWATANAWFSR